MQKIQKVMCLFVAAALLLTMVDGQGNALAAKKGKTERTKVSSVKFTNTGKKLRLQKGKRFKLKTSVKVKPNKGAYKKLKFTSSNRKVVPVNSHGSLKGLRVGTAKITASSKTNPKKKASVTVSVTKDVLVTGIRLNRTKITVDEYNEDEIQLSVRKILPSNAKNKEVEWFSSDEDVADVDEDGLVTTGDVGTATITAEAADQGGAYATCRIIVTENEDQGDEEPDDSKAEPSEQTKAPSVSENTDGPTESAQTTEPVENNVTALPDVPSSSPEGTLPTAAATKKPTAKPIPEKTEKPVQTPKPKWTPDPEKKVEDITLTFGNGKGYLFEDASQVKFADADNYPEEGIDVRYYDKVTVKYTSDREMLLGDNGWYGKATLSSTDERLGCTPYTDGLYRRYLGDVPYENGCYAVQYNIKEVGEHGGLLYGYEFEEVGLIDCVSVQLDIDANPYVDSEGGAEKGVNFRLMSIEFSNGGGKKPEKTTIPSTADPEGTAIPPTAGPQETPADQLIWTPGPAGSRNVTLSNNNVFFKTGLEDEYGGRGSTVTGTEYTDGSISFRTSALYSGGGMSFYVNEDKSPLDLSRYSEIIVTLSSPQEETDIGISLQSDQIGEWSEPENFEGSVTFDCLHEANRLYRFAIDLGKIAEYPENDGLEAYGVFVKYDGYGRPSEDATDEVKKALKKTVMIHAIELIAKEGMEKQKDPDEAAALEQIIASQRELGALVSEDLDSDEYRWNGEGKLTGIRWGRTAEMAGRNLSGSISFSTFPALEWLDCEGSLLSGLDVSGNSELKTFNCSDNQLETLDVSGNPELKVLNCSGNQLETLDVTANPALLNLNCSGNRLEELDVSKNLALEYLRCTDNNLESLDTTDNQDLKLLECDEQVKKTGWGEIPTFDPDKAVENVTLGYGEDGYLFEEMELVPFSDAETGYPEEGIDVRYYDRVIVTYTCDRELKTDGVGWSGKSTLNSMDITVGSPAYGDGMFCRHFMTMDYEDGGYKVEYDIRNSYLNGYSFDQLGLLDCVGLQLSSVANPYVDSEDGSRKGVNIRLKSIEFIVDKE